MQFLFRSFKYLQITRTGIISYVFELIPGHCFKFRVIFLYLLDLVCFGIQFYLLLSLCLCFIYLLYLDLYVLGDDALIS